MDDLVYRLCAEVFAQESFPEPEDVERRLVKLLAEAANEIERLRGHGAILICEKCRTSHKLVADVPLKVISFDCMDCGHRTSVTVDGGK